MLWLAPGIATECLLLLSYLGGGCRGGHHAAGVLIAAVRVDLFAEALWSILRVTVNLLIYDEANLHTTLGNQQKSKAKKRSSSYTMRVLIVVE